MSSISSVEKKYRRRMVSKWHFTTTIFVGFGLERQSYLSCFNIIVIRILCASLNFVEHLYNFDRLLFFILFDLRPGHDGQNTHVKSRDKVMQGIIPQKFLLFVFFL